MLECHYPNDCEDARCWHLARHIEDEEYSGPEDPEDFDLDPNFSYLDLPEMVCCFCGCTEFKPCEGGCAWSERYLIRGLWICSSCKTIALSLDVNLGAFEIRRRNMFCSNLVI